MSNGLGLIVIFLQKMLSDLANSRVVHLPEVCTVVISALVVPVAMTTLGLTCCSVVWFGPSSAYSASYKCFKNFCSFAVRVRLTPCRSVCSAGSVTMK